MADLVPLPPPPPGHVPPPPGGNGAPLAVHQAAEEERRPTRRPMRAFDRVRILWLLLAVFAFYVWRELASNPLVSFHDAFRSVWLRLRVVEILFVVEAIRQIHYLFSERSARWHRFVTQSVFGRWDGWVERRDPWTRFRAGRLVKLVGLLLVIGLVLGAQWGIPWYRALFDAPSRIASVLFSTSRGLPLVFQILLSLTLMIGQFVLLFWFLSRGGVDVYRPEEIKERFKDVKGQEPVLAQVKDAVGFLEDQKVIENRGGRVPKGILLWGPPGTGKTLMAKAVAGETSKPFVFVDPGAFINMFLGVGVLKVKSLYRKVRKLALKYGGVIVFFDEADSLGSRGGAVANASPALTPNDLGCTHYASASTLRRLHEAMAEAPVAPPGVGGRVKGIFVGNMGGMGGGLGTVQALLTEMDGLNKPRGFLNRHVRRALGLTPKPPLKYRILHMMATNLPDALDPAFLRPGRIDRIHQVARPTAKGREETFRFYLDKVTHNLTDDQVHRLAVIQARGTGASIADIVSEAVIVAVQAGHDVITYADVVKARHLKTHGPPDDFSYTDWENHAVAIHEACHAVAMFRLKKREVIDVATIERRGGVGGFVAPVPLEEEMFDWRSGLENEVMTFLASLAGERLFFDGDNSVGVGGDLRSSTMLVLQMHAFSGMGDSVASHGVTLGLIGRNPSAIIEDGTDRQFLETKLGQQVDAKLQELLDRVGAMLADDRDHVLAVAHALETHKTVTGEDIVAVIEGTVGLAVDGRRYHDPVARAELETYHAAVVHAMKENAKVSRPLPIVAPPPDLISQLDATAADVPPTPNGGVSYPTHPPVLPGEGGGDPSR